MSVAVDDLPPSVRVGPHDIRFATLGIADAKRNYGTFVPAEQETQLQQEYSSGSMDCTSFYMRSSRWRPCR